MDESRWSPEQAQLETLLNKCRQETNTEKLFNHLMAVKTFLIAHAIQQSTLLHQIQDGRVVQGKFEDKLIKECAECVGETHKVMQLLHKVLRHYEKKGQDSMEFRVDATRLISRFDRSLNRFRDWFADYHQKSVDASA
ncbi:MAG: hypothetical protein HQL51_10675 [Magnetococcales bacterium]|nr:hypothetical protein [Magnetococcales bacterium]